MQRSWATCVSLLKLLLRNPTGDNVVLISRNYHKVSPRYYSIMYFSWPIETIG